jgi:hypothetical protein
MSIEISEKSESNTGQIGVGSVRITNCRFLGMGREVSIQHSKYKYKKPQEYHFFK